MAFNTIITDWIPYGLAIIGIFIFLAGVVKLITNKEGAFSNLLSGILVVLIAIGFRLAVINYILPNLR
jgi:hypothetical protein